MNRYFILGSIISFIMVFFTILGMYVLWQLYKPIQIITIDNPVRVVSNELIAFDGGVYPVVYKNEEFVISFNYEKFLSLPEHTYRTILCEDGNLVTLTDIHKNLVLGKQHVARYGGLVIPQKTSTNTLCYVRYLMNYQVNPFRTIIVPTQTELFYVKDVREVK